MPHIARNLPAVAVLLAVSFGTAAFLPAGLRPSGYRSLVLPLPFKPRSLSPFERQKAERLLRTRYPCLGCHERGGSGGRVGPALDDVGARRSPEYVYAMISDPQRTVPGTVMPRVPMPPRTLELIASYLLQDARTAAREPVAAGPARDPSPSALDSPALYGRYCASCHGVQGRGDGPNASYLSTRPAPHASAEAMSVRSDDALFDTIFGGGYIMNRSNLMPPFGATLTAEQIRGLVRHIRTLCRCEGPAWSRDSQTR